MHIGVINLFLKCFVLYRDMKTICLRTLLQLSIRFNCFPVDNPSISVECPWFQDLAIVLYGSFHGYHFNVQSLFFDVLLISL